MRLIRITRWCTGIISWLIIVHGQLCRVHMLAVSVTCSDARYARPLRNGRTMNGYWFNMKYYGPDYYAGECHETSDSCHALNPIHCDIFVRVKCLIFEVWRSPRVRYRSQKGNIWKAQRNFSFILRLKEGCRILKYVELRGAEEARGGRRKMHGWNMRAIFQEASSGLLRLPVIFSNWIFLPFVFASSSECGVLKVKIQFYAWRRARYFLELFLRVAFVKG